jgi:ATP-dependent DNA helicase UvrD/PcrA
MDYLEGLNEPQREGVLNTEGPTMIIAGAGSGKTRVLTYRIVHLIRGQNVDPYNILALTFTNKAAAEMRHRIESVIGSEARNIWMGTFHSVFARILRSEASVLGYPSNFTIYDTDDSKMLIRTIVKEMNLDDKMYKANIVYNRISGAKNRLISWQEYNNSSSYKSDDEVALRPEIGKIYRAYVNRCFKAGAMDFDDLLFNTNVLFRDHLDILNKYQHRFNHVLVDEFQDTNVSQYLITKKLSAVQQNICVVGDDAQSIYAFRGADIQNILNFEKDYPDLRVIKLEQNYRSTQTIVDAANAVISNNSAQLTKQVWTQNQEGEKIELIRCASDNEEGKLVASSIFEEKMQNHLRNSDFAVLYRTNSQSRSIEEALRRINLKYKIVGGMSFYQRKEIKDMLAYMRFSLNHNDEASFKRIINLPKRGIGDTTVNKLIVHADEMNRSIWDVLQTAQEVVGGRGATAIADFVTMIKRFKVEINKQDAFEAATSIAKGSGLMRDLYADKTIEGLSRYENLQELLNAVKEFVESDEIKLSGGDDADKSLGAFLQEVTLLTGVDEDNAKDADGEDDQDRITLMTIHMAKGLEFKNVHIVGMEEDLFPSQMMLTSRADLEEERRLFYVAITRAKQKLFLTYALSRYRFGRLKSCEPSRFIEEIDQQYIKASSKHGGVRSNTVVKTPSNFAKNLVSSVKKGSATVAKAVPAHKLSAGFEPSDTTSLSAGMKVEHPKFGYGKVVAIEGNAANRKAKVNFDNFGEKTLLLSFAKLKIH